jgi:serine/threonine-protein kinase
MALTIGTQLGSHEITALLGKGGMGEVYRARDLKLKREVAIKILPEEFSRDADRVSRFQREAEVLASLNHPNIACIYDLEEHDGSRYLVLELVEGETLADRIGRGPIPVEEAVIIAIQICEALEEAHEKGIIHRDLKPANVKLTSDGKVKVLDFGLAKAIESTTVSSGLSNSPTLLSGTVGGMIIGTAAYMSPEQARGRPADQRSDVFAFGCVLYELLSGMQAFKGEDVSDVLASVMKLEPDFNRLPANLNPELYELVRRCVAKNRKERWHAIGDLRIELQRLMQEPHGRSKQRNTRSAALTMLALTVTGLAIIAGVIAIAGRWSPPHETSSAGVMRFSFVVPDGQRLTRTGRSVLTISPNGDRIAYVANNQLYLRKFSETEVRPVDGTATDPSTPFFSPDGQWIGFYSNSDKKLKKVAVTGGAAVTITDQVGTPLGASWCSNGQILLASLIGVVRVPDVGGIPETVFKGDNNQRSGEPHCLPDGDHFLITLAGLGRNWSNGQILLQSLKSGERKTVLTGGSDAKYVSTGHLVYALGTTLLAIRFDISKLAVIGGPVPVVENVSTPTDASGTANFAVANNGTMVYALPMQIVSGQTKLVFVDRRGSKTNVPLPDGQYSDPRVSPDGKQIAVTLQSDGESSIWLYDIGGGTSMRRLTFEGNNSVPQWTRDGRRVIFRSIQAQQQALLWQNADGSGVAEPLVPPENSLGVAPNSVSPDGKILAFFKGTNAGDVWVVSLAGDKTAKPLITVPVTHEDHSAFSPDGKWIAYRSQSASRMDIFVQPYPPTGSKYQVTTSGVAESPLWSPDGKQIFYVEYRDQTGQLMSVDVHTEKGLSFGSPAKAPIDNISKGAVRPYDISPDGRNFLVTTSTSIQTDRGTTPEFRVIANWFEELKQRVPVK